MDRAKGMTLAEIGDRLDLTRERVRQIEAKACMRVFLLLEQNNTLMKVYAESNMKRVMMSSELAAYLGNYSEVIIYALQNNKNMQFSSYSYDKEFDVFEIDDSAIRGDKRETDDHRISEIRRPKHSSDTQHSTTNYKEKTETRDANPGDDGSKDQSRIGAILTEQFKKGFRINSALDLRKIKAFYNSRYEETIALSDESLVDLIKTCGLEHDGILYIPKNMVSDEMHQKLIGFIEQSFRNGANAVYFEALYDRFSDDLLNECVYDADMLRDYLKYTIKDSYFIDNNYIAKGLSDNSDPATEVKNLSIEKGVPLSYDQIHEALPHLTYTVISSVLRAGEFISNGNKEYFHISLFVMDEHTLEDISIVMHNNIAEMGYISGNELLKIVDQKFPYVFENNAFLSQLGIKNALAYILKDEFLWNGAIVCEKGQGVSIPDVYNDYSKQHTHFTIDELKTLKTELGSLIMFEEVYKNAVRINERDFVSKKLLHFDVDNTDSAIDLYCKGEYIPINDINSFGTFPDAGYSWNAYLLEQFVYGFSHKYRLVHNYFNESTCSGALVKNSSNIYSLNDLLSNALADSGVELEKQKALSFFCKRGYLVRSSYSDIEAVIIRAREIRNKRGL